MYHIGMSITMPDQELETLSLGAFIWHSLILYVTILLCVITCRHIREVFVLCMFTSTFFVTRLTIVSEE
jgi:hypothetical protein